MSSKRQGKSPSHSPAEEPVEKKPAKSFRFGCPCRDGGCEPLPGFDPAKAKRAAEAKKRKKQA